VLPESCFFLSLRFGRAPTTTRRRRHNTSPGAKPFENKNDAAACTHKARPRAHHRQRRPDADVVVEELGEHLPPHEAEHQGHGRLEVRQVWDGVAHQRVDAPHSADSKHLPREQSRGERDIVLNRNFEATARTVHGFARVRSSKRDEPYCLPALNAEAFHSWTAHLHTTSFQ